MSSLVCVLLCSEDWCWSEVLSSDQRVFVYSIFAKYICVIEKKSQKFCNNPALAVPCKRTVYVIVEKFEWQFSAGQM